MGLNAVGALAMFMLAACSASSEGDAPPHWEVVWSDDFEGDALDSSKWSAEISCWGGGNNERQCYTDRSENVRLDDGVLRLIARPEPYTGPLYSEYYDASNGEQRQQPYTSGKVGTYGKVDWKYGRFSARMKLPAGQSAWTAFWMMPTENKYGSWPLSGEIDIMEAVNLETPCEDCPGGVERRTSGAIHFGGIAPQNTYLTAATDSAHQINPANDWHVYTVEWAEGVIQWFVNGEIFMRINSDEWRTDAPEAEGRPHAPFDQRFHLLINLAVGGNMPERWNGREFDDSTFPAEVLIDWVRVEHCAGDEQSGRACLSAQKWEGAASGPSDHRAS